MPEADARRESRTDEEARRQLGRMTRRSFIVGGAAALLGVGGWYWLRTRAAVGGVPWPLRRVLEFNERVAQGFFNDARLAPTFPPEQAGLRLNGNVGLGQDFDPTKWKLHVETAARPAALELTLDDIKALPRVDLVTQLNCVEGWTQVVHFAGARLLDFAVKYRLGTRSGDAPDPARPADLLPYVGLDTPDRDYYVGLDAASALHPQTLLCYAMNGAPLTLPHGAPLRLFTPVKYGFKGLKRIGTIRFTEQRPADYWAERGYDWYAGL